MAFDWEIEIPPSTGDRSGDINKAIENLSSQYGGGTIYLAPAIYTVSHSILRRSNVNIKGAFKGAGIWDTSASDGTIITWAGASGGIVFLDAPKDWQTPIVNGSISNLTIDGAGVAGCGLQSLSSVYAEYVRLHVVGVTQYAYYFGTISTTAPTQNYRTRLESLSAVVLGDVSAFVLDGVPGSGRNTCFMTATNCTAAFANGCGYAISNGDDNVFIGCSASREPGGTGPGIYFGATGDGKFAVGNQFYGFWSNGPIDAMGAGIPSRGNMVFTTCVDVVPTIYQAAGSSLTVVATDGEPGLDGFVRGWPSK